MNAPPRAGPQKFLRDRRWLKPGVGSVFLPSVERSVPVVVPPFPESARRCRFGGDAPRFDGFLHVFGAELFRGTGDNHRFPLTGTLYVSSLWSDNHRLPLVDSMSDTCGGPGSSSPLRVTGFQLGRRTWKIGWEINPSSRFGAETKNAKRQQIFDETWPDNEVPIETGAILTPARPPGLLVGKDLSSRVVWSYYVVTTLSYIQQFDFLSRNFPLQHAFTRFYGIWLPILSHYCVKLGNPKICHSSSSILFLFLMILSQAYSNMLQLSPRMWLYDCFGYYIVCYRVNFPGYYGTVFMIVDSSGGSYPQQG